MIKERVLAVWPEAYADHRKGWIAGSEPYDYWEIVATSRMKAWQTQFVGSGPTEESAWQSASKHSEVLEKEAAEPSQAADPRVKAIAHLREEIIGFNSVHTMYAGTLYDLAVRAFTAEAARDRQYEYNVEQIAKQAALEARNAKLTAALREVIPYITPHVMKGRLQFALSESGLVETKPCRNCGEDNYELCGCDRT